MNRNCEDLKAPAPSLRDLTRSALIKLVNSGYITSEMASDDSGWREEDGGLLVPKTSNLSEQDINAAVEKVNSGERDVTASRENMGILFSLKES